MLLMDSMFAKIGQKFTKIITFDRLAMTFELLERYPGIDFLLALACEHSEDEALALSH